MKNYLVNNTATKAIDTNILIYAYQGLDERLKKVSIELLKQEHILISHFAFIEFLHCIRTKFKRNKIETMSFGTEILKIIKLSYCDKDTYDLAFYIVKRYDCAFEDSIIIADAILNDCDILYSRDFQHNQIFEQKLRVVDPFI